jgi:hypothetical protein
MLRDFAVAVCDCAMYHHLELHAIVFCNFVELNLYQKANI